MTGRLFSYHPSLPPAAWLLKLPDRPLRRLPERWAVVFATHMPIRALSGWSTGLITYEERARTAPGVIESGRRRRASPFRHQGTSLSPTSSASKLEGFLPLKGETQRITLADCATLVSGAQKGVSQRLLAFFPTTPGAEVLSCEHHAVCIRDRQWNLEPESRLRLW